MKIKKYRPAFFEGFEDVYYDVNSKKELLESELCKCSIDNGYEICFSKDKDDYGFIMAIREEQNEECAGWWVLSIIYNTQDVATLSEWLPDWDLKREEYKNKLSKFNNENNMKDPYKDLHYHINVIKEESLHPIAEFCIKTTLRVINLFDHLFDHRKKN